MKMFKKKEASPPKEKKKRMTKERAVRLLSSALVIAMVAGLFFGNVVFAGKAAKNGSMTLVINDGGETSTINIKIKLKSGQTNAGDKTDALYDFYAGNSAKMTVSISGTNKHSVSLRQEEESTFKSDSDEYQYMYIRLKYTRRANYTYKDREWVKAFTSNESIRINSVPTSMTGTVNNNTEVSFAIRTNISQLGMCSKNSSSSTLKSGSKLTINYYRQSFNITVNNNGGSGASGYSKYYGEAIGTPSSIPTRQGYQFNGWSDSGSGVVKSNRTLTAQWKKMSKTFKFHTNGGTAVSDQTLNDPGSISAPETTRSGNYVFKGWSENADGSGTKILAGQDLTYSGWSDWGEVNLYAVWERKGANWNMENVVEDEDMFTNDEALEGEAGTTYDEEYTNSEYAHKDSADDPGYFSGK